MVRLSSRRLMKTAGITTSNRHIRTQLLAISLITMAGLMLEIALTRLFSVLFFPPTVFAILSLAILGIGLGAAWVTWRPGWRVRARIPFYLGGSSLSVLVIAVVATIPGLQLVLFGLVVLPYLFIGMVLTTLFSHAPERSPQLYLADLAGAGLGALLAIPLHNVLGGLNAVFSIMVLLALPGLLLGRRGPGRFLLFILFIGLVLLSGNLVFGWFGIDMGHLPADKPIVAGLAEDGAAVVESRWDAFARTDLIDPGDGGPLRLYMDGAAGSVMPPAENNDFLWDDIGLFPFATEQPERVFLIGPGGGLDIWFALQGRAETITGVEVNTASVTIVEDLAEYNGDLYGQPNVNIIVDDGRSVLERDTDQFDLIFLSQVVTLAAERNGYALVENSAYTVEAFRTYREHLTPNGQIGLKLYDEPTLTRALSTALAVLKEEGMTDVEALQHVIALLDQNADPPIPLLIIGKQAFTRDDSLTLGAVAEQVGFTPLFLPGVLSQSPLDEVASGATAFEAIIADADNDLSPTTDDRPFFFQFERGIPQSLQPLLLGVGVILLAGTGLLIVYRRRRTDGREIATASIYFAGLGVGFIMVEIAVIQQTRLFLGHPTTATAVVLAVLLISGGVGSGFGDRWFRDRARLDLRPLLLVLLFLVVWWLLWPRLQAGAWSFQLPLRLLLVTASLLPLGFVLGMPFPLGLRAISAQGQEQVALAWTVNGVMSVVGSVLAVALAIMVGFSVVLLAGAIAYTLSALAIYLPLDRAFEKSFL